MHIEVPSEGGVASMLVSHSEGGVDFVPESLYKKEVWPICLSVIVKKA